MTAFTKVKGYRLAALACAACLWLTASSGIAQVAGGSVPNGDAATAGLHRIDLANQILNRWQPIAEASGQEIVTWREIFSTQFGLMSDAVLRRLAAVSADAGTAKASYAQFAQAIRNAEMQTYMLALSKNGQATTTSNSSFTLKLGSTTSDQVFVPIVPCRVVDSRNAGGGGPIAASTQRPYYFYVAAGNAGYSWSNQGGQSGTANASCPGTSLTTNGGTLGTVAPSAAVATVTAVAPTAAGNFVVWGGDGTFPQSSAVNFNAGENLANTTVIPRGSRTGAALDFTVRYNGPSGAADVVVDVVGYFVENVATALDCTTIATDFTIPASNNAFTAASGSCPTGRTLTGGGMDTQFTTASMMYYDSAPEGGDHWRCRGRNVDFGATFTGTCYAICCRLPGQ